MTRTFKKPFHVETNFYNAEGELLEWHEEWGDCSYATKVTHVIVDCDDHTIATHTDRETADRECKRLNSET